MKKLKWKQIPKPKTYSKSSMGRVFYTNRCLQWKQEDFKVTSQHCIFQKLAKKKNSNKIINPRIKTDHLSHFKKKISEDNFWKRLNRSGQEKLKTCEKTGMKNTTDTILWIIAYQKFQGNENGKPSFT